MTLSDATPGSTYQVAGLDLPTELSRRLEALGMIEGSGVKVLRRKRRGAMIITVRGTRFAVGYAIAKHISVKGAA